MKNKKGYWSNVSNKKPKEFTNIKGKPYQYKYNCDLSFIKENDFFLDVVEIRVKMNKDRNIDYDETKKMLIEDYDIKDVTFYDSIFKRDGDYFPYITNIKVYDNIESYFNFKKLKYRKYKIGKILDKKRKK